MQSWPELVERQKTLLMAAKDKFCLPLAQKIPAVIRPNHISLGRLFLVVILLCLDLAAVPHLFFWTALIYFLAKISDMFDGRLARYRQQITKAGEFLDVLVDKLVYLAVFFILINLWPELISLKFIFLVLAVALLVLIADNSRQLFNFNSAGRIRTFRRVFEGVGYLTALVLLIFQIFYK